MRLTSLLLVLTAWIVNAGAAEIPVDKEVITLEPKFGTVTFAHKRHSEMPDIDCVSCHHTAEAQGAAIQACHDCHSARNFQEAQITPKATEEPKKASTAAPSAQDALHKQCRGCHEETGKAGKATGPNKSCRDCHV